MPDDPIIEEIHKIREKLLEEHGGFEGYFQHVLREQEKIKDRLVTLPRRKTARKKRRA